MLCVIEHLLTADVDICEENTNSENFFTIVMKKMRISKLRNIILCEVHHKYYDMLSKGQ